MVLAMFVSTHEKRMSPLKDRILFTIVGAVRKNTYAQMFLEGIRKIVLSFYAQNATVP
jgi:hypothetical protein